MKIYVLNGPNLNLLGSREPEIYGRATLQDIAAEVESAAADLGIEIVFRQTNDEGQMIEWVHEARTAADAVIINPAALTHYSLSLREALAALEKPCVEVHLSNIYSREEWRRKSVVSEVVSGVIAGFGSRGYLLALDALSKGEKK